MAHLVRADFGIGHLVAHGRLDGWFPRFVLGHQEFLFNGQGLTWLMALIRGLTVGAVSNEGALKAVVVASLVAMPAAVCFLALSFGLNRRAAGLAALLSLFVSTPYGIGLRGMFDTGLVPHQVGAVIFCLALGAAVRITHDARRRWIALLGASLAALAITHLISLLILGVLLTLILAVLAATHQLDRPGLFRLLLGCASGAGLSGFWLVPFLAHRSLQGIVTTWGPPPLLQRLGAIASGDILYPAGLGLVVAVALIYEGLRLRRGADPSVALRVVPPIAYLLLAHALPYVVGTNGATLQLANRGLGYAGLLAILPLAAVAADVLHRWESRSEAVVFLALTIAAVAWAPGSAGQFPRPVPAMTAAAGELARLVPDGARFASERDYPAEVRRTGVLHPETWLAHTSGRNSLNGFNLESSSTPRAAFLMDKLDDSSATRIALRLARYGVTHVVATSDGFARKLTRSPRFRPVWSSAPLTILALDPAPGAPPPASQVSAAGAELNARLTSTEPEHPEFEIDATGTTAVTLALAWSPKWHGRLNGTPVRIAPVSDGLVGLSVPAGRSELRLDYRGDAWDRLGVAFTLVTAFAGGISIVGTDRRRRRDADKPKDS